MVSGSTALPILALMGPSGSGKTTLKNALSKMDPATFVPLLWTVSRPPRPGERDGVDSVFETEESIRAGQATGRYLDVIPRYGTLYAIGRAPFDQALADGKVPIIDASDAEDIRAMEEPITVFLAPPSWPVWAERLVARGTESDEKLLARLNAANDEVSSGMGAADYVVVNDHPGEAARKIVEIVEAEKVRRGCSDLTGSDQLRALIQAEAHRIRPDVVDLYLASLSEDGPGLVNQVLGHGPCP
jgi:guanylate kinase